MDKNLPDRPLRILTWHIHGSYLYYLVQTNHHFFLPTKPGRPEGYGGKTPSYAWPDNVHEVEADEVRHLEFDCVLFQSRKNYLEDRAEILSPMQQELPAIYLEHDPPRQHPTDTRHWVDDPNILLVHVTHFNDLMWDSNRTPTMVIDHGVVLPDGVRYTGELERGLVIVNGLQSRGRRLGSDIFDQVRREVPLDLVGIDSEKLGGLGSIPHQDLPGFASRYRFIFNPIRYTSLGLSICEMMTAGIPIIGLATTEMVTAVINGISGYVDTDIHKLVEHMLRLISDLPEARRLGEGARRLAADRFNIRRFAADWNKAYDLVLYGVPARDPV